jgi:hypothetical protein
MKFLKNLFKFIRPSNIKLDKAKPNVAKKVILTKHYSLTLTSSYIVDVITDQGGYLAKHPIYELSVIFVLLPDGKTNDSGFTWMPHEGWTDDEIRRYFGANKN